MLQCKSIIFILSTQLMPKRDNLKKSTLHCMSNASWSEQKGIIQMIPYEKQGYNLNVFDFMAFHNANFVMIDRIH